MIKNNMIAYMMIFIASFLLGTVLFGGTHAYLIDTETSTGNTFTAVIFDISGEIDEFDVPEEDVVLGDVANFTVSFSNTGTVDLVARAVVEIRRGKKGNLIATVNSSIISVSVKETEDITVSWNTTNANPGNYWAIARVLYDYRDLKTPLETPPTDSEKFKVVRSSKHIENSASNNNSSQINENESTTNLTSQNTTLNNVTDSSPINETSQEDNSTSINETSVNSTIQKNTTPNNVTDSSPINKTSQKDNSTSINETDANSTASAPINSTENTTPNNETNSSSINETSQEDNSTLINETDANSIASGALINSIENTTPNNETNSSPINETAQEDNSTSINEICLPANS